MMILWDHERFKVMPRECYFSFTILDMMSCTVSDPAQKNCGDSYHPVFNDIGTTSSVSPRDTYQPSVAGRT